MRVAFSGSRTWLQIKPIKTRIEQLARRYTGDLVIIHGACPKGVDLLVDISAKALKLVLEPYPADWDQHGFEAGFVRNRQMLVEAKPDLLIAFFNPLDLDKPTKSGKPRTSTGTLDAIRMAQVLAIPVEFHTLPIESTIDF